MTHSRKERIYWTLAISALITTLVILAVLQFHWSRELDEAASTRMRANLMSSMMGFRLDFARELANITQAMQAQPTPSSDQDSDIVRQLETWRRSAAHPDLVNGIYVLRESSARRPQLFRLDLRSHHTVPSEWPDSFAALKQYVAQAESEHIPVPPPPGRYRHERHQHEKDASAEGPRVLYRWRIDLSVPALIRGDSIERFPNQAPARSSDWVIVELNPTVLRDELLPELAERYFGGTDGLTYDVAVVYQGTNERLIYSSGSQLGANANATPDARLSLFGPPFGTQPPAHADSRSLPMPLDDNMIRRLQRGGIPRLEPLRFSDQRETWELLAKHRKGSLEAALASVRHEHLAISFGVLLLLTATVAMVIISTRRAQVLARQQMEFVAGVSHELRTPLAVITSAADNIVDRIVTNPTKLVQYGDVIRKHARQLTQLVEQILLFSASRNQSSQYNLGAIQIEQAIKTALERSAELLNSNGFTLQQEIAPNLPDVLADSAAVCQCLQNLITNAVKYSGDNKWIRIRAAQSSTNNTEVFVCVEDKGIGIARPELRRIFEPFYRSPEVVSGQIRGTGLGLALCRSIAEAMHGRLAVTSEVGKGSAFTLYLPVAEGYENTSAAAVESAVIGAMEDEPETFDR